MYFVLMQEWQQELKLLLTELTGQDGKVKAYGPNPQTQPDAAVAWSKITAVYGVFKEGDTFKQITRSRHVTQWLGKKKKISETQVCRMVKKLRCVVKVDCQWFQFSKS